MLKLSDNVQRIEPSATMAISSRAAAMRSAGEDVIALAAGEPDFATPQHIVDAAKAAQTANIKGGLPTRYSPPATDIVFVKNDSGAPRSRFEIHGIDAPVIEHADNAAEFKSRVAVSCVAADPSTHVGRWVVLLDGCAAGALAPAVISGVCPCQIEVLDDSHKYVDVNPESGSRETPASAQFGYASA